MAKVATVEVRKADMDQRWREEVGKAIDSVRATQGLSLKEFADRIDRDERQVSRWFSGQEHAQVAAVFAVEQFRQPLVFALAKLAGLETKLTITGAA